VDNYTDSSAILSALGIPATFFLTTDRLEEPVEFWWDVLEEILLSASVKRPPQLEIELPAGWRVFSTRTADDRLAAHTEIYHSIVGAAAATRDEVVRQLTCWSGRPSPRQPPHRRMNGAEIRELASRRGHSIGAHTARHVMLPRQAVAVQRQEIEESRRALTAILDRPVRSFAYPFGAFNDETVQEVRASSFAVAVTCEDALVAAGADPLRLPRLDVTSRPVPDFAEWLDGKLKAHFSL